MAPGEVVNNILTALLTVAFVYTVISSFIKLSKDEIGSKNFESTKLFPHQFPSLVICPWVYGSNVPKINALNNDFTLEDIEKLPRIQDVMTVKVRMSESYTKNM